jgi:hypothetical protein
MVETLTAVTPEVTELDATAVLGAACLWPSLRRAR